MCNVNTSSQQATVVSSDVFIVAFREAIRLYSVYELSAINFVRGQLTVGRSIYSSLACSHIINRGRLSHISHSSRLKHARPVPCKYKQKAINNELYILLIFWAARLGCEKMEIETGNWTSLYYVLIVSSITHSLKFAVSIGTSPKSLVSEK